jgi:hypothetical protein
MRRPVGRRMIHITKMSKKDEIVTVGYNWNRLGRRSHASQHPGHRRLSLSKKAIVNQIMIADGLCFILGVTLYFEEQHPNLTIYPDGEETSSAGDRLEIEAGRFRSGLELSNSFDCCLLQREIFKALHVF